MSSPRLLACVLLLLPCLTNTSADEPKICYLKDGVPHKYKPECDAAQSDFTKCAKLAAFCVWGPCYPGQHPAGVCPPAPAPPPTPTPPPPPPTPPTPSPAPCPGNGSCSLLPSAPPAYGPICTSTKTCAACVLLNETCSWHSSGPAAASHCELIPGMPPAFGPVCASANTSVACAKLNETCRWSGGGAPVGPPDCHVQPGLPPAYGPACKAQKTAAACATVKATCEWGPPPPPGPAPPPAPPGPPSPPPAPAGPPCCTEYCKTNSCNCAEWGCHTCFADTATCNTPPIQGGCCKIYSGLHTAAPCMNPNECGACRDGINCESEATCTCPK
jgi:hypothetical protein